MDLDQKVYLYYDFIGGGEYTDAITAHFESGEYDAMVERGQIRFFHESTASARETYARFAGCETVNGNDAILDGLHEAMSGRRVRFAADEGNYFITTSDLGPFTDLSLEVERSTAHDLTAVDLGDDKLTERIGRSRFAVLQVRAPEGAEYVAIASDGTSHSWAGEPVQGKDTVETVRALDEAGALPDEVLDLMGDAARATLEAGRDEARFPGP